MVQWWLLGAWLFGMREGDVVVLTDLFIEKRGGGNGMGISFMQWLGRRNQGGRAMAYVRLRHCMNSACWHKRGGAGASLCCGCKRQGQKQDLARTHLVAPNCCPLPYYCVSARKERRQMSG